MFASHISITHWWIAAIVSGLAVALAIGSLPSPEPMKLRRWLVGIAVAVVPGLVMAAKTADEGAKTGLQLYILVALTMAAQRVIFARWLRRRAAASEAEQDERISRAQTAIACLSLLVTAVGIAVVLSALTEPA
jgi:uncharacterized membrane protein YbhN (UPF0104 family)